MLAVLGGCAGGGGSTMTPAAFPVPPSQKQPVTATVTFTMKWNSATTSSSRRMPKYVPATAQSVSVTVNGGTVQCLNSPGTTLVIDAPVGTDTFAFVTFDAMNCQGNVLSRATVTKQIVLGAANTVSATLDGVVVSVVISLSNPSPNAGVPATVNVNVAAKDADGNTIVGAGSFSTPIHLTISDPTSSGTMSLSTNTIPNAATTATLTYSGGTLNSGLAGGPVANVVATASGVPTVSVSFTPTPTFYQFSIPTAANKPQWIAAGSDGNMWFSETGVAGVDRIARITPAGVVTECPPIPSAASNPQGIIGASDGNLWFTEFNTSKIGRVTTTCTFTEFSTLFASDQPQLLVDRGDGNVWFSANGGNHVGYQGLTSGTSGETTIPTVNSKPYGIATAPDNNLYFTESSVDQIGRISMLFGTIGEISLTSGTNPLQMVRGPDGNVWFTEHGRNMIGRLSPNSFSVTGEFPTITPMSGPVGITVGQDGALWFTEPGNGVILDEIGRVTTGGVVSEFTSPVTGLGLKGIAVAPDGSLWFAEPGTGLNPGRIGKLVY